MTLQIFSPPRRAAYAAAFALILALNYPAAAADPYVFDKNHTEIRFSWSHFGVSRQAALFLDYDGGITFDQAAPEKSSIEVTIKPASVYSRVPKFDDHLKSSDFFDVQKYPEISFKSAKVEKTGDKTGKITGDLTIKGITKPVTLDVTFNYAGEHPLAATNEKLKGVKVAGFAASTKVKRSDFNLGLFAPAVSDEVVIEIQTELHRKAS